MKIPLAIKAITISSVMLVLHGCAVSESHRFTKIERQSAAHIKDSKLYVYSFLDAREIDLGANFIQAIKSTMNEKLLGHSIDVKYISFRGTKRGMNFPLSFGEMRIPVEQVIDENQLLEKRFAPKFRLIILPTEVLSSVSIYGQTPIKQEISWRLVETETNKVIWQGESSSTAIWGTVTSGFNDDKSMERAKLIVNQLIAEWKKSGVL